MSDQTEWLDRHAHQKMQMPDTRESLGDMLTRFSEERIRENLARDQKRNTYTFFDYMNTALHLPNEVLVMLTDMPEIQRREFVRCISIPQNRPVARIWKKATFVNSGDNP